MDDVLGRTTTKKAIPRFASASRIRASRLAESATFWSLTDEARALPHHLAAEIEHAPVAAYQHLRAAEAEHRLGQILVQLNQHMAKAKMILQV